MPTLELRQAPTALFAIFDLANINHQPESRCHNIPATVELTTPKLPLKKPATVIGENTLISMVFSPRYSAANQSDATSGYV